jgi:hypothetical protein
VESSVQGTTISFSLPLVSPVAAAVSTGTAAIELLIKERGRV